MDGLIEMNLCSHRYDVESAFDVKTLSTRVALEMHGRAALDPPLTWLAKYQYGGA